MVTMGHRAWAIPAEAFAAAWNGAPTLEEAIEAVKALGDGPVPRWAVRARAAELLGSGTPLKEFPKAA